MLIGQVKKNAMETILVSITEYQGHRLVDAPGAFPGRQRRLEAHEEGLAIPLDKVPDVLALLKKAERASNGG